MLTGGFARVLLLATWSGIASTAGAETVVRVTPQQALDEAIKQSRAALKPVRIELGAGRYELKEPIRLNSADNGLTIAAAEGAKPMIVGSVRVGGWKLADPDRDLWQAEVPDAKGKWRPRQMFVDGTRAQRARTPNEGFLRARGGLPHTQPFAFPAEPGSLKSSWPERGDVEIVFYQKWIDARLTIKSIDPAAGTALLNGAAREWMSEGSCRYFIENAPEALDAPGEWHLDRRTGVLSYLAPRGRSPEQSSVTLPRTDALLVFEGCSNVTVRGITFAETDYPCRMTGISIRRRPRASAAPFER